MSDKKNLNEEVKNAAIEEAEEKTLKKSSQLYNSGNPYQEDNTNIEDYNHRENNINNNNDSF